MGRTIDAGDLFRTVGDVIAIGKAEEWPEWMLFNLTGVDNEPLFPSTGNRTSDILQGMSRALDERHKAEENVRLISETAEKLLPGRTIDAENLFRTVQDVIAIGKAEEWPEWMFNLTGVDNEPLFPSTGNRTSDILQGLFRALDGRHKAEENVRLISETAEKLLARRRHA